MGVSPGPLLESSGRRTVIGITPLSVSKMRSLPRLELSIQEETSWVYPANAVVTEIMKRTEKRQVTLTG
jgi:hypothetical protein